MRKRIERTVNRISAVAGVGAFAVVLSDSSLWTFALSFWLAAWFMLHLVGQSVATAVEQDLPAPLYYFLVKPVDTAAHADGFEESDVSGAYRDSRILSDRVNGKVIR